MKTPLEREKAIFETICLSLDFSRDIFFSFSYLPEQLLPRSALPDCIRALEMSEQNNDPSLYTIPFPTCG